MRQLVSVFFLLLFLNSCIPLRVAPTISDYKLVVGKKFKRSLPKRKMFIFEDVKEVNHFFSYINKKFVLNDLNVYDDVPFSVSGQQFFFSFYEITIPDKGINLAPTFFGALINATLNIEDGDVLDPTEFRNNNFYIAIEVYSDQEVDCLADNSLSRDIVLKYLRALKNEYLSTHNYNEVVFKN